MANSSIVGILKAILDADVQTFAAKMSSAGTTVQELGKKIEKDLEPRQRAINSLVKDFLGTGEIRRAEEYAKAIEHLGGVTRLTEADQRKVNTVVNQALDHYKALGQQAPKHLVDLANATSHLGASLDPIPKKLSLIEEVQRRVQTETGGAVTRVRDMALGYITGQFAIEAFTRAGRLAIDFLKDSVQEALEADKAQRQLTAALTAQGTATPQIIRLMDELATKYQETTVHSDDLIKQTQVLLTTVGGVLPAEMDKALDAVTNLSAGMGIDLRSATMLVAKAFEDNFGALKKAGVQIDETRAKAEGMTYVLGQIQDKFGGQAQAEVQSYEGQLKQLENQWKELQETVGKFLIQTGSLDIALFAAKAAMAELAAQIQFLKFALNFGLIGGVKIASDDINALTREMDENADTANELAGSYVRAQSAYKDAMEKRRAEIQKTRDAEKKAADARNKEIQEMSDALGGKDVRDRIEKVALSVQRLHGAIDKNKLRELTEQLNEWHKQGYSLPPALERIRDAQLAVWAQNLRMTDSFGPLNTGMGNFIGNLGKIDMTQWRRETEHMLDVLDGLNIKIKYGLPDSIKNLPKLQLNPPPDREIEKWYTAIDGLAGSFSQLAQISTGAMSTTAGAISLAVKSVNTLDKSFQQMAAGGAQALSGWTGVIGVFFSAFSTISTLLDRKYVEIKQLIQDAGGTPLTVGQHFQQTGNKTGYFQALEEQLAQLRASNALTEEQNRATEAAAKFTQELSDKVGLLQGRLQSFGGFVPNALDPFIADLLQSGLLTGDLRKQIEGLSGTPSWQTLQAEAERLGIKLESLGQGFSQARISDIAIGYVRSIQMFEDVGADVTGVLEGMKDELSALVQEAARTGTELPETLRPYLDKLVQMGLLVDENGEKITDLTTFKFADVKDEALQAIVGILEQIRDLLKNGIPQAAQDGARDVEDALRGIKVPTLELPMKIRQGDFEMPDFGQLDIQKLGRGGIVTRPTLALIGESGPEAVTPLSGADSFRPVIKPSGVYLDGRMVGEITFEYATDKIEKNDGGGATESPVSRWNRGLGRR